MVPCGLPAWFERSSRAGPPRQLRPGHGAFSESPLPARRSARLQALGSIASHRRGEDDFPIDETARNVAQRRSIEDAPRRRLPVLGEFHNLSQLSLPASTVPASSAMREVCEHQLG